MKKKVSMWVLVVTAVLLLGIGVFVVETIGVSTDTLVVIAFVWAVFMLQQAETIRKKIN